MAYIYLTTNLISGKRYIGKCIHNSCKTKHYLGSGKILKQAILKHGAEQFKKEIIVEGDFSEELLFELEKHYIQLYAAYIRDDFYNISPGGKLPYDNDIRTIYMFDLEGNHINTFNDSYSSLARKFNTSACTIRNSCINKSIFKKANCFFSLDKDFKVPILSKIMGVKVHLFTREGKFVNTFSSIKKCTEYLGNPEKNKSAYNAYKKNSLYENHYIVEDGKKFTRTHYVVKDNNIELEFADFNKKGGEQREINSLLGYLKKRYNLSKYPLRQVNLALAKSGRYKDLILYTKEVTYESC